MHRQGESPRTLRVRLQVIIATPVTSPKGGQFVLHAKALHGNPFDGHTLGPVTTDMEKLTGVWKLAESTSTKGIAATTTRIGSESGSRVRSAASWLPSAAR